MLTLYGLKTCDTCRKARRWLDGAEIAYQFHDVREDGLDRPLLAAWAKAVGWEVLVNRKSTTWRGLPEADRAIDGPDDAVALLEANPTLLKRPVFTRDGRVLVGFDDAVRAALAG